MNKKLLYILITSGILAGAGIIFTITYLAVTRNPKPDSVVIDSSKKLCKTKSCLKAGELLPNQE